MRTDWIKYGIICFAAAGLSAQSVFVRIHHARIESGFFKWDVELKAGPESFPGLNDGLGHSDFYFFVNGEALHPEAPEVSRLHPVLANGDVYLVRSGRAQKYSICWVALDFFEGGSGVIQPQSDWERLFTVALEVADPSAGSGLYWHRDGSGLTSGDGREVTVQLQGASNVVLTDSVFAFEEVTEQCCELTDKGSHGAFWADVDEDGFPDLYAPMYWDGAAVDLFYWNENGLRFIEEAESRGIQDIDGGSHGACFADFDNDGDYDLVNGSTAEMDWSNYMPAHNNLYINLGNGYFEDITESLPDMAGSEWMTRSVCAFDLENDGDLDIFTVTGYLGSDDPVSEKNELYRNEGNNRFVLLDDHPLIDAPGGQGVCDTDFDLDGDTDIFIANRTGDLNVLRNDGNGGFDLVPPANIGIMHIGGDGISFADIDNDGDSDMLLVTGNLQVAHLYRNQGDGTFLHARSFEQIKGYMGDFMDVENDGDLDLLFPYSGPIFLNDGTGSFIEGFGLPLDDVVDPRSIAFADFDDDGNVDLAVGDKHNHLRLIKNTSFYPNRWLKVRLTSPEGQAGAFGAKISVFAAGETRGPLIGFTECRSSSGYLAQHDPVRHFGLGLHDVVDILVQYADGRMLICKNVASMQTKHINGTTTRLKLKVFLEGAWADSQGSMRTDLKALGILPTVSPFNEDPARLAGLPEEATDWLLLKIVGESDEPLLLEKSVVLLSSGLVTDGLLETPAVHLDLPAGRYTIGIYHRNHLPVQTRNAYLIADTSDTVIDLTTGLEPLTRESHQAEVAPGIFALIAGNAQNGDHEILADDLAAIKIGFIYSSLDYRTGDINLDGKIDESDYALTVPHMLGGIHSMAGDP